MKPADAAEMNRLSRMTREQREDEWLREMVGTIFPAFGKPAIREQVHPVTDGLDEPHCDCGAIDREPHWDECAAMIHLEPDE